MLRTSARRGVVGGTALAVGLAGLTIGQGAATASPPLPVEQAGPVAIWGPGSGAVAPLPAPTPEQASQAYIKVVANGLGSAIGLTAGGEVEQIGTNVFAASFPTVNLPTDALAGKTVVDIAGDTSFGAGIAVTSTGEVLSWNQGNEPWVSSVGEMQGSVAAAISSNRSLAAVVKQDGSVRVFGSVATVGDFGQLTPPALTDATDVFFLANSVAVFALKSDGTLTAWGRNSSSRETELPAITTDASDDVDVVDVASVGGSAVALLSDGTLAAWGGDTELGNPEATSWNNEPPASTDGEEIVALAGGGNAYFAVDSTGQMHMWGAATSNTTTWPAKAEAFADLPDGIDPANITGLSANNSYLTAIEATFGFVAKPTISGTPTVGQTLTATPATFTNTPDETTGQWLANGTEIAGATDTTYHLTSNELGKTITYRETATRGEATATATSDPTGKVIAATVGSATTISAPAAAYGRGGIVTVTVKNGKAGTVTLSGAGATQRKAVSGGRAVFALPRNLPARAYALTASYSGTTGVNRSAGRATLQVVRAAAGPVRANVLKASKLTRKKKGKAAVTVATAAGLAKATGRVTITLKKGKQTKRVTRVLRNGKVTTKLPKLPKKGKWKVTVTYTGDANYLAGSSRPIKVRVR